MFNPEAELNDSEFNKFRKLIYNIAGISLSDRKRELVKSRLARRLRFYNLATYGEYYDLLCDRLNRRTRSSILPMLLRRIRPSSFAKPIILTISATSSFPLYVMRPSAAAKRSCEFGAPLPQPVKSPIRWLCRCWITLVRSPTGICDYSHPTSTRKF